MNPIVSVIIPTHNRPAFLKEAIASIKSQTFRDFEIIVVANGPPTEQITQILAIAKAEGCRTIYREEANLPKARNVGIAAAKGEFLAFLDDDDLWPPSKLEQQIMAARQTGADMVSCDAIIERGSVSYGQHFIADKRWTLAEELMLRNKFPAGGSGIMVRASKIREANGFDGSLIGVEDWDMWRRLSWTCQHVHVPAYLVTYRYHGGNLSFAISWTRWDLRLHLKGLRDCPRELAHMRPQIVREIIVRTLARSPFRLVNRLSKGRLREMIWKVRRLMRLKRRINALVGREVFPVASSDIVRSTREKNTWV